MSDVVDRLVSQYKAGDFSDGTSLVNLGRNMSLELSMLEEDLQDIELGRLNWSPRKNWIEIVNGDLPKFITDVAIGIMKGTGYPRERAIPIAISRIKVWARGGGGVNADTVAKAAAALAAWEALKAKAAARRVRRV